MVKVEGTVVNRSMVLPSAGLETVRKKEEEKKKETSSPKALEKEEKEKAKKIS